MSPAGRFHVTFVTAEDGSTWPADVSDLEWTLRYGLPEDRLLACLSAATVVHAYHALSRATEKKRRIVARAIRGRRMP